MISSRSAAVFALLALAACTPPPVVVPPPPLPPPPPPPPVETEAERVVRGHQLWEEGTALGRQGRWIQAERAYREAVGISPDSATYHLALATALLQQQRDTEAADAMLAAIRLEEAGPAPNHRVLAVEYEQLIQILERVNRMDEARQARERQRLHRMLRDAAPPD
ncbi:MAG TPA: tetratricopeptide repeat protein [Longimicrobiaceae bacterium]|nr:tetratricopeptide repeat protein [Longimicrobiaceae bacterium]